jgi:GNAT superfamily N-acetyltransferase
MIEYARSTSADDLNGILHLQRRNLPVALSEDEIRSQGFVTVVHSIQDLDRMNSIEPHIIAKDKAHVIAYLLAMTTQSKDDIPVLRPMFAVFENLHFAGRKLSDCRYIVVGQVCVDKAYRGTGVLDACYAFYRDCLKEKYDFAITEIDVTNTRSLAAHKRIGFQELHRYTSPDKKEWVIVAWEWNHSPGNENNYGYDLSAP